jgi:hypothetical protein
VGIEGDESGEERDAPEDLERSEQGTLLIAFGEPGRGEEEDDVEDIGGHSEEVAIRRAEAEVSEDEGEVLRDLQGVSDKRGGIVKLLNRSARYAK